jgi:hypothetical protein
LIFLLQLTKSCCALSYFVRVHQLLDAVAAIRLPRAVSSAWQPFDIALQSAAAVDKWEAALIALEAKASAP